MPLRFRRWSNPAERNDDDVVNVESRGGAETDAAVIAPGGEDPLGALEGDTPGRIVIEVGGDERSGTSNAVKIFLFITVLSIAPGFLMMMTSFTRIIIVMGFVRRALGTQTLPPNQVLLGLSLFLTLFIMAPQFNAINDNALQPMAFGKKLAKKSPSMYDHGSSQFYVAPHAQGGSRLIYKYRR